MKELAYLLFMTLYLWLSITSVSSMRDDRAGNLYRVKRSTRSGDTATTNSWIEFHTRNEISSAYIAEQDGCMQADKIGELPGQPGDVDFDQYAGYVTVDSNAEKALFYYFVESSEDPWSKPLILWLSGGPGCSSIGAGAFLELGPFRVNSDGRTLFRNEYAWNNVANVIFLESPAGVGYSYGNSSTIFNSTGDSSTANDAYVFLVKWLDRFPQYQSRPFFIAGESYAGFYVPELAYTIQLNNEQNTSGPFINLKGIIVGNPLLDIQMDNVGEFDYLWTHGLISDETHAQIIQSCNFTKISADCNDLQTQAILEAGNPNDELEVNINLYNIYAPVCLNPAPKHGTAGSVDDFDPCSTNYIGSYLNLKHVQEALHAKPTNWNLCSNFNWTDKPQSVLPIIQKLIASNIRVWIYSGDTDGVLPVTSTRYSLNSLKLPIQTSWYAWLINRQVGGYVVGYEGLTFVTVRGAGHQVPSYQPERALAVITSFLQGTLPPSS
ncbi:hypothetical protein Droror1_Dr00004196 [Drosera rotundifolia]